MPAEADVYDKAGEKIVILRVRQFLVQPIQAPNWLDLRVGFLLSVTKSDDDDDPTGLAEEIGTPPTPQLPWTDRYAIGLTDRATGSTFLGFTNRGVYSRPITFGTSELVSSDIGLGDDSVYWRPGNGRNTRWALQIFDQEAVLASGVDGSQPHFVQDAGAAGGYATLLMLRFTRDDYRPGTTEKRITMTCKKATAGGHSGDVLFTGDPSEDLLRTNMLDFPDTVQQLGPVTLSQEPSAFYVYWPFEGSRLRIHCMGILKRR